MLLGVGGGGMRANDLVNNDKNKNDNDLVLYSAEPPKPKLPKVMLEFVDSEALDWLSNLVDIDP